MKNNSVYIRIKKTFLIDFILPFYLFVAIFLPNFCNISTRYIIFISNILILFAGLMIYKKIHIPKIMLNIMLSFLPFWIYYSVLQLSRYFFGNPLYRNLYKKNLYNMVNIFIFSFLIFLIVYFFSSNNKKNLSEYNLLIRTAGIQFVCVVVAFVFPNVRNMFIDMNVKYSKDEVVANALMNLSWDVRSYGFAGNLFDAFGYIVSILIMICFAYGIEKKSNKYVVFACIMIIMPMLNSRTGILLSLVGILIVMLFYFEPKKIFKYLFGGIILLILFVYILNNLNVDTREWIMKGIIQTWDLVSKGDTSKGVYSEIFGADLVYPRNLFFGEGSSPELIGGYAGIDSGYIQCIWRYGIFGSVLLLGGYIRMYIISYKSTENVMNKAVLVSTMIIFLTYLFKLFSISNYGANVLIFGIPAFIIAHKNRKGELMQ